jgi:hypothetical protein
MEHLEIPAFGVFLENAAQRVSLAIENSDDGKGHTVSSIGIYLKSPYFRILLVAVLALPTVCAWDSAAAAQGKADNSPGAHHLRPHHVHCKQVNSVSTIVGTKESTDGTGVIREEERATGMPMYDSKYVDSGGGVKASIPLTVLAA